MLQQSHYFFLQILNEDRSKIWLKMFNYSKGIKSKLTKCYHLLDKRSGEPKIFDRSVAKRFVMAKEQQQSLP